MAAIKSNVKSARKRASNVGTAESTESIQLQLRIIAVELRCALSAISVAAHALCKQNADIDADVAMVLRRGAGAPVHAGLERIEEMLRTMESSGDTSASALASGVH
jgi:hypothetical protein